MATKRTSREFYVGYLDTAPPGVAARVRVIVGALLGGAVVLAGLLVFAQRPFPAAAFEFGHTRTLVGTVLEDPVPMLLVGRPGRTTSEDAVSRYLLTIPGKWGAQSEVAGFHERVAGLEGTLIYRGGMTMVEVVPGSVEARPGDPAIPAAPVPTGRVTLVGEIVDGKCYLGVMNPGEGKPHRACAARCISGGAPPLFVARGADGDHRQLLLVGADREPINTDVLPFVAEPVEITGDLERHGDVWVLRADPTTFRRLL